MASPAVAPRLHVLLARDAPTAVVIRRGPSRYACTIGWDRRDDSFTVGQWLRGHIYEERCDLSPDGAHLIYFALTGRWHSETKGSYTALSRAPYLKALGLWPQGDTWGGGGLFADSRIYWICNGTSGALRTSLALKPTPRCPWPNPFGNRVNAVYGARLARDGWRPTSEPGVAEKRAERGWRLRRLLADGQRNRHALWHVRAGRLIDLPDREWADVDGSRLVWAVSGRLFAGSLDVTGIRESSVLHDFNGMRFEAIAAPYDVEG